MRNDISGFQLLGDRHEPGQVSTRPMKVVRNHTTAHTPINHAPTSSRNKERCNLAMSGTKFSQLGTKRVVLRCPNISPEWGLTKIWLNSTELFMPGTWM